MAKPGTKPASTRVIPHDGGGAWHDRALMAATVAVLAPILIQCLVGIAPELYWDVDPRSSMANIPVTVLGPAAMAWLDVISILLAAAALAVHVAAGGAISWPTVVLAAAGAAACAWHMPEHAGNMFRCGLWLAAVALAVAAMHLASRERPRRIIAAALVAMLVPLAIKAAWYVWVEHPETVRTFMEDRKSVLESQGWTVGSPQDLIYQRRLETPEATGVFGLSNPFGSVVAACTLVAAAGGVWLLRARRWARALPMVVIALLGVFTVALSRSRGAAVATVLAMLLLGLIVLARKRRFLRDHLGTIAILFVVAAVGAVLLRGSKGPPPTVQGERSVYFRYQYWKGAERIMTTAPGSPERSERLLRGIGPAALQPLYSIYKDPLNPEEVTSTHNVFVDLITMLGVGGLAWSVMLLMWLHRASRAACLEDDKTSAAGENTSGGTSGGGGGFQWPSERKGRINSATGGLSTSASLESSRTLVGKPPVALKDPAALIAILALTAVAFGVEYAMHLPEFNLFDLTGFLDLMNWLLGAVTFIIVAYWLVATDRFPTAAAGVGLFLGALVLLIHNQIEMTFFHQGSAGVAFFIVGAAAGVGMVGAKQWGMHGIVWRARWAIPVAIAAGAVALIPTYALPVTAEEETLRQAADSLRAHDLPGCVGLLDRAITELPCDPSPCRWRARVLMDGAGAAARDGRRDIAARMVQAAVETPRGVTEAVHNDTALLRTQAQAQDRAAEMLDDPRRTDAALELWKRVIAAEPYGLQSHLQFADLLWRMGRFDEAKAEYRRVMDLDADSYLDPLRQLSERDWAMIKERTPTTRPSK